MKINNLKIKFSNDWNRKRFRLIAIGWGDNFRENGKSDGWFLDFAILGITLFIFYNF